MAELNFDGIDHIIVLGERPEEAPDGWHVFNAPRPLHGSWRDENERAGAVTWNGDFITGRLYAAVNPAPADLKYNDPQTAVDFNRSQDARRVTWMSAERHRRRVLAWVKEVYEPKCIARYGQDTWDEVDLGIDELDRAYRNGLEDSGQGVRVFGPRLQEEDSSDD